MLVSFCASLSIGFMSRTVEVSVVDTSLITCLFGIGTGLDFCVKYSRGDLAGEKPKSNSTMAVSGISRGDGVGGEFGVCELR